ncbi:MAG: hypothetical protein ACFFAO_16445, partial [Candidatus Hermodarchaeota archaeon]
RKKFYANINKEMIKPLKYIISKADKNHDIDELPQNQYWNPSKSLNQQQFKICPFCGASITLKDQSKCEKCGHKL